MLTPRPPSPLAAKYTTFLLLKSLSCVLSVLHSGSPQLMLTTPPPAAFTSLVASDTAAHVGSVAHVPTLQSFDTTRYSLACGAMACAHSMSRPSLTSQSDSTSRCFMPGQTWVKSAC